MQAFMGKTSHQNNHVLWKLCQDISACIFWDKICAYVLSFAHNPGLSEISQQFMSFHLPDPLPPGMCWAESEVLSSCCPLTPSCTAWQLKPQWHSKFFTAPVCRCHILLNNAFVTCWYHASGTLSVWVWKWHSVLPL